MIDDNPGDKRGHLEGMFASDRGVRGDQSLREHPNEGPAEEEEDVEESWEKSWVGIFPSKRESPNSQGTESSSQNTGAGRGLATRHSW